MKHPISPLKEDIKAIALLLMYIVFGFLIFTILNYDNSVIVARETNASSLLVLVNKERASVGVKPLTMVSELTESAFVKANDLIDNDYWNHDRPDGVKFSDVIFKYLPDATKVGENLTKCYDSVDSEFVALKNSTSHYENMIDKDYQLYGDATIIDNKCKYTVQHFAQIGK